MLRLAAGRGCKVVSLSLAALLVLSAGTFYRLSYWPLRDKHPQAAPVHGLLALVGVRLYAAPDVQPLDGVTILIRDGRIEAIGTQVPVPEDSHRIDCPGCVATAGFWNTHVHFTERKWANAEGLPATTLAAQIADMLTSRGFTTVVDTGSNLRDTIPLRRRIERRELPGPMIYTAGAAQYPPHGVPYYLRDSLPKWLVFMLAQPANPAEAAADERRNIDEGADLLKLFTGSYVERGVVLPMPIANARAAAAVAHEHHQLVFAHESDAAGVRVALDSGVDVLAHAADTASGVDDVLLAEIVAKHMAIIPTLKMFATTVSRSSTYLNPIHAQVRRFHELGGELLFGTDVGYMTDYDTREEFMALMDCGIPCRTRRSSRRCASPFDRGVSFGRVAKEALARSRGKSHRRRALIRRTSNRLRCQLRGDR